MTNIKDKKQERVEQTPVDSDFRANGEELRIPMINILKREKTENFNRKFESINRTRATF